MVAGRKPPEEAAVDDDEDKDDAAKPMSTWPNTYLDLSTTFSTSPPNSLRVGVRSFSTFRSTSSSQTTIFDMPLTVELTDRITVYAGLDTYTSRALPDPWMAMTFGNWGAGFSADIVEHEGHIPTVTLSASVSRPLTKGTLGIMTTQLGRRA
jgi:hypothetical protein